MYYELYHERKVSQAYARLTFFLLDNVFAINSLKTDSYKEVQIPASCAEDMATCVGGACVLAVKMLGCRQSG